jgi:glycosyltransferase involved in cell wall biosynthesis
MVYVSTFEGFGVPIIEAMRSGVPVITSNVTAMPEVSQDAAILIDPFDTDSICNAMIRIHADPNYCSQMITKGIERSKNFSWEKTSVLLWESVLKTTPFK